MEEEKFDFDKENTETPKPSNKNPYFLGAVVILILLLGAGFFLNQKSGNRYPNSASTVSMQNAKPTNGASGTVVSGSSDEQLNQDSRQIDSQLNQLDQDMNSVNQEFTNQSQESTDASQTY